MTEKKKIKIAFVDENDSMIKLLKETLENGLEEEYDIEFVNKEESDFVVSNELKTTNIFEELLKEKETYKFIDEKTTKNMDHFVNEKKDRVNHKQNKKLNSRSKNYLNRK